MQNQEKINNKKILVVEDELVPFELYKSYLKGILDEKMKNIKVWFSI